MKNTKREILTLSEMVKHTRHNLKEFNISDNVIELVIKGYISCKRELLLQGKYVYEDNISTEGISVRGVTKNFTDDGFTVKLKASPDWSFKSEAMDRMKNDEELQEVMDFDTERFLNEEDK